MKDEMIHKAKPVNRYTTRENRDIDMTPLILLLGVLLIIVILLYCKSNPSVVIGLADVLTMVEV